MGTPASPSAPRVRLSAPARRFVAASGGVLYVWVERSGKRHGWLAVATRRPGTIEFGPSRDVDGVQVHVQAGMRAIRSRPVTVRLWRFPRLHLDASGAVVVDPT